MVTISAAAVSVAENQQLHFRVRAEPAPRVDLTVGVTIAYRGCQLAQSSVSATIAAGNSYTTLTVPTEGAAGCTVTATIADGDGYRAGKAAGASDSATVTAVTDAPDSQPTEPVVTIAADENAVVEGAVLSFTLTATPPPTSPLEITVSWSDPGSFLAAPGRRTVTISTDGTSTLPAATRDDAADEPDGEVTVTILDGSGYTVGIPGEATVAVTDNDASTTGGTPPTSICAQPAEPPTTWTCPSLNSCTIVSISAVTSPVTEGTPALFTLTAQPVPDSDLKVALRWQCDGRFLVERPPATVTLDAGSSTASITIDTVDDDEPGGAHYIRVHVAKHAASESNPYGVDGPSAIVDVTDND